MARPALAFRISHLESEVGVCFLTGGMSVSKYFSWIERERELGGRSVGEGWAFASSLKGEGGGRGWGRPTRTSGTALEPQLAYSRPLSRLFQRAGHGPCALSSSGCGSGCVTRCFLECRRLVSPKDLALTSNRKTHVRLIFPPTRHHPLKPPLGQPGVAAQMWEKENPFIHFMPHPLAPSHPSWCPRFCFHHLLRLPAAL